MRAFLVFLLFCAFALTARWYYVCKIKNQCGEVIEAPADVRAATLELRNGEEVIISGQDQFRFDSAQVNPVMNANNREFLDQVAAYFQQNKDNNLTITGLYRPSEANISSGMFENLGVARANVIREMLVNRGINKERITLDFKQASTEALATPVMFSAFLPVTDEDTPEEYEKTSFTFENMTFSEANFEYNSAIFKPGEPFLLYADSVKTYLEVNTDKLFIVTGHTDSIGGDPYNDNLGLQRAISAKEYFEEMGIVTPIETKSMGRTLPRESNATEEGRAKNRRVNFKIEDKILEDAQDAQE
ncbi:MAG: OmpA family protein [Saprospiraceae bacterium]